MELSDGAKTALSRVVESSASALADAMDSSGKMVKENVKELANEVIIFKGYIDNAIAIAFIMIVLALQAKLMMYISLSERAEAYVGMGLTGLAMLGTGSWLMNCIAEILKAKFAPRLFLTEYALGMLKKDDSSKK